MTAEDRVKALMQALEDSVADAKKTRDEHLQRLAKKRQMAEAEHGGEAVGGSANEGQENSADTTSGQGAGVPAGASGSTAAPAPAGGSANEGGPTDG